MTTPSITLIRALRSAASKLGSGAPYQWGHMGSCNCGNLAQELTRLSKAEIHEYAMRKHGDWSEQADDYCPTSGLPMDLLMSEMLSKGLEINDLKNLERLSDPEILQRISPQPRNLRHNIREDVILYMRTWADMLEEKLLEDISLKELKKSYSTTLVI